MNPLVEPPTESLPDPLPDILEALAEVALKVRHSLSYDAFDGTSFGMGSQNVHGETQQALDLLANQWAIAQFKKNKAIAAVISEEEPEVVPCHAQTGEYLIALDPLDGSSNIGLGVPTGTLFSVFKRSSKPKQALTDKDCLPQGAQQILAGYFLYGTATALVYVYANHIHTATYFEDEKQFRLTPPPKGFATEGHIYSVNDALAMSSALRAYLKTKRGVWSARYIGALVADFHRNLLRGGLFCYPATPSHPSGKLRLLYECSPLALIAEAAGAKAVDEQGTRILSLKPTDIHQRTSFYVGPKTQIHEWLDFREDFDSAA